MISGQELFVQRARIKSSLETSLTRAYENGIDAAEKTRLYRIALAQKMLELKEDGSFEEYIPDFPNNTVAFQEEIDHFVDCCLNGTECICKLDDVDTCFVCCVELHEEKLTADNRLVGNVFYFDDFLELEELLDNLLENVYVTIYYDSHACTGFVFCCAGYDRVNVVASSVEKT